MVKCEVKYAENKDTGIAYKDITPGLWHSLKAPDQLILKTSPLDNIPNLCIINGRIEKAEYDGWVRLKMRPFYGEVILKND